MIAKAQRHLPHPDPACCARRLLARDEVEQLGNRAYDPPDPDGRQAMDILTRVATYNFARLEEERNTWRRAACGGCTWDRRRATRNC